MLKAWRVTSGRKSELPTLIPLNQRAPSRQKDKDCKPGCVWLLLRCSQYFSWFDIMCFVLIYVDRHWSFFLWTLHLLLAKVRPSLSVAGFWWHGHCPLKAAWPGRKRWQNEGVEEVLVCFPGAGDPSPSDLLQHSDDCATECLSRPCVLLGFASLGMQECSWKKEGLDFFEEKCALKEHNLYHFKGRSFQASLPLFPMFRNFSWNSCFPERNIKLSGKLCNNPSRLILWWVLVLSYF